MDPQIQLADVRLETLEDRYIVKIDYLIAGNIIERQMAADTDLPIPGHEETLYPDLYTRKAGEAAGNYIRATQNIEALTQTWQDGSFIREELGRLIDERSSALGQKAAFASAALSVAAVSLSPYLAVGLLAAVPAVYAGAKIESAKRLAGKEDELGLAVVDRFNDLIAAHKSRQEYAGSILINAFYL